MKSIYINKAQLVILLFSIVFILSSCKKFLTLDAPETKVSSQSAFKNNNSATAVLTGLYAQLSDNYINAVNLPATSYYEELSADNLVLFDVSSNLDLAAYYQNKLEPTYTANSNQNYWTNVYKLIYTINTSITSLTNNIDLTPAVSTRLLGEAYFLRAFCYFYLVNLYGDVPLILSPDYKQNVNAGRDSISKVYDQIVSDLSLASTMLDNTYAALDVTKTTIERVRPNLAAVNALAARVYLYQKNYQAAEASATKVISELQTYSFTALDAVYTKNSTETIWALQPVSNGFNTREAQLYILPAEGPDYEHPVYISTSLLNSFEPGDARKTAWLGNVNVGGIDYWYPAKYKVPFIDGATIPVENTIVLRLAEQYLIRAEARNKQSNKAGALEDLNAIRNRSRADATATVPNPLPELTLTMSQDEINSAIMHERRVELFTEWGHRWFDLRRSGTIDAVMTEAENYKGGTWENYKSLYPIPFSDILLNPAIKQNFGYTN